MFDGGAYVGRDKVKSEGKCERRVGTREEEWRTDRYPADRTSLSAASIGNNYKSSWMFGER